MFPWCIYDESPARFLEVGKFFDTFLFKRQIQFCSILTFTLICFFFILNNKHDPPFFKNRILKLVGQQKQTLIQFLSFFDYISVLLSRFTREKPGT